MAKPVAKSLDEEFHRLVFLSDRRPDSKGIEASFCRLADYRDGGIFLAHYSGYSDWERHPQGDEIVFIVSGETTLILLHEGQEVPNVLRAGELLVVPQNTWHRFESPQPVRVMTVTPQPTDHSVTPPSR
jgi:mannose-6-phosphate isomerase-like protein (cupin superfamily)